MFKESLEEDLGRINEIIKNLKLFESICTKVKD